MPVLLAMALLTAAPAPAPAVPAPTLEALELPSPEAKKSLLALRALLAKRSPGYRHVPFRVGGNFLGERWCSPAVSAEACDGGAVANDTARGSAFRTLETLHYQLPKAFGIVLHMGEVPAKGELGVRLWLSEGGAGIVGEGFEVRWLRLEGDRVAEELSLGSAPGITVLGAQLAPPGVAWRDALKAMAASPESLSAFAKERLDALEKRLEEAFAKGEIKGWDEGPYRGGGIPPARTPRPLKPDEEKRERAAAKSEIERRRAFVARSASAMHAHFASLPVALLSVLPPMGEKP